MARKSKEAQKRSAAAKAGWATRAKNERAAARAAKARSEAAKQGWITRRATPAKAPAPVQPPTVAAVPKTPQRGGGGGGGGGSVRGGPPVRDIPEEFWDIDDFYGGWDGDEEDEY